jgi:hypothetical protein
MLNTPTPRTLTLHEYVATFTQIVTSPECDVDVVFFRVACSSEADAASFQLAVDSYRGTFGNPELRPLNGMVYNFIELGAWMGDQELALRMMALGTYLEVWRLITPRDVLTTGGSAEIYALAKIGMVAIVTEAVS